MGFGDASEGLLGFYAVSAVGLAAGVGTASWLYAQSPVWWLAGAAGALMGAVWNYSMSTLFVWRLEDEDFARRYHSLQCRSLGLIALVDAIAFGCRCDHAAVRR